MKFFLFFITCLLLGINSFSQAGRIDSSFGIDGIASCLPKGGANSLAIQTDGKIVVAGDDETVDFTLARFKINGTLDSTFGTNGIVDQTVGFGYDQNETVAIQTDGKIIEGGTCLDFTSHWVFALARFNTDGTLDKSFNPLNKSGTVLTSFNDKGYVSNGFALSIQPDGKIVQVGRGISNELGQGFAVVRFNADGSLDNSFGSFGKILTPIGNSFPVACCISIQTDGKILVGGYSYSVTNSCFALIRYNVDGTLDNSFGVNGKVTTYFGNGDSDDYDVAYAMALQQDGKILMTGYSYLIINGPGNVAIARYNSDGSLDATFGSEGKTTLKIPSYNVSNAWAIALQKDNKIVTAGDCGENYNRRIFLLTRHQTNGLLDSTFGTNGIVLTVVDTSKFRDNSARSVAVQQDQKIVVAGGSNDGFTVLRYLSELNVGIPDISSAKFTISIYPNPTSDQIQIQSQTFTQKTISILTLLGQLVFQNTFYSSESINVSSFPRGMYIVKITDEQGNLIGTEKLVKE